jgi:hypothetical protein
MKSRVKHADVPACAPSAAPAVLANSEFELDFYGRQNRLAW